jgi:structure-specific endonuclease subunit SLX1
MPTFGSLTKACKSFLKTDDRWSKGKYCIYLIAKQGETSSSKSAYIGCTNNLYRRMRQHQGEIKGGARRTRYYRGCVQLIAVLSGGFLSKRDALQCEWIFYDRTKRKSLQQKMDFLNTQLFQLERWTQQAEPIRSEYRNQPFCVTWFHAKKQPATDLHQIENIVVQRKT